MLSHSNTTSQIHSQFEIFNNLPVAVWVENASMLYRELQKISVSYNGTIQQFLERNPHELPRLIDLIQIIDVNDFAVSLYKASHKNQLIKGIRNFFIKESFHDFTKMLVSLYAGSTEYSYTSSKITVSGHKVITQVTVKIPQHALHDWSQMIVTETDISQFIKREVALKIQSDKIKQDNTNKEKILSIIAHDLKNPFNTILGFSELLLTKFNTFTQEQVSDFLKYIHESANQSYHLLSNLLNWSKMQQSGVSKNLQIFHLEPLISNISQLIHTTCVSKNITIHQRIAKDIEVYADINMLAFVIRNVLTNAIKFSYKNSDIFIHAYEQNTDVVIEIADEGIGMDIDTQLQLFDPEKISSRRGTENECGTGIGLMLSKEFIEKQHGSLEIESEMGKGTKVTLRIPKEKKQYL
ncbi:MAG TPA: HAMP domain-containing sensor histidine kinase [Bacteroidales bacterium]|nr:HAMP domain-containing sensor histidine kinase [Bacteroidales bacterium]